MALDQNTLSKLLEFLHELIEELEEKEIDLELLTDSDQMYAIEHRLQLAIESTLNITEHIISGLGLGIAETGREVFLKLGEKGIIDKQLAKTLGNAVGLRNVLVHNYLEVDLNEVVKSATVGLDDLREFAKQINSFLAKQKEVPDSH